MDKKFNISKVNIECEAQSHRILACYIRYMFKKLKLRKYDHSVFITCARYNNYVLHINGLLLKSREHFFYKDNLVRYLPSKCRELDILVERFVLRNYKIKVIYDKNFKNNGNSILKPFNISLLTLIRDIIFDLKSRRSRETKITNKFKNLENNTVLIIGHQISDSNEAYNNLSKKLSVHFGKSKMNTKLILPFEIGLSIKDKIRNSNEILWSLISKLINFNFLKLSDINFIIFQNYRQIFKKKLINYFLNNNISLIICSYINSEYESIYYEAAKELKIKYFNYDYSLGYPIKDNTYLRYLPDTRKYSDVIFSCSKFRSDQYLTSCNFLDKRPLILNHICPQSDYSLNKESIVNFQSSGIKIGLVDNVSFNDCGLNYEDIPTLIKFLRNNEITFKYILQSKMGDLENEFKKSNFNRNTYVSGLKGDFSLLQRSDLIISIGWQSVALKAASAFKKPLIFYSKYEYPYKDYFFSINKKKNAVINNLCNDLWISEGDLNNRFNNLFLDNQKFSDIKNISSKFIKELCFYEEDIEDYFIKYFIK